MSLLTVGVMLMVIESYGYLAQNTAQTQRDRTTQRREERKGRETLRSSFLCVVDSSWSREFANNPG